MKEAENHSSKPCLLWMTQRSCKTAPESEALYSKTRRVFHFLSFLSSQCLLICFRSPDNIDIHLFKIDEFIISFWDFTSYIVLSQLLFSDQKNGTSENIYIVVHLKIVPLALKKYKTTRIANMH
jgi:hypothetical protein